MRFFFLCLMLFFTAGFSVAQENEPVPEEHIYASPGGVNLKVFVIHPEDGKKPSAAVVVFHGGGWAIGSAEWGLGRARHFASLGMVGVSAQYRLSNEKDITPLDAMADARAVIRWMRVNADKLGIDKNRIAAYGWSAGGHLAACAAAIQVPDEKDLESAAPDAMILVSPAVDTANNDYYERLLLGRASAKDSSPDHLVRPGLPPTLILQGRTDTVTPTPGVAAYAKLMKEAGNRCELIIYEGVGHLFTPSTEPDDDWPNPDPEVRAKAYAAADDFLESLGFID
jgi:acetyl esterase/lipase